MAKALMIQGTGSNVGKSLLVAGLARAARARGLSVAPFKPQNMSNNAAVTTDGGEIGRAQALQARAAGLAPHTDMNPVLLKPESEQGAQVIVQGQRRATLKARDYAKLKPDLMAPVLESFHRLAAVHDLILVEGAGSPAEINLRHGDIANLGFAAAANVPVILVGDIDRGGVIAQLVGTSAVLPSDDNALIRGFIVNKFRGDVSLFESGMDEISQRTGWAPLGVAPWFPDAWRLPAEDILDLSSGQGSGTKIAIPRLGRLSNFDDFDPLAAEPGVEMMVVEPGRPLPGDASAVILGGSKNTISDLADLRANGWDIDLAAHIRRGGHVLGLCGGYQMLGKSIDDPSGIEGPAGAIDGLGHLDVTTTLTPKKQLALTKATDRLSGTAIEGYEIHIGTTTGGSPWLDIDGTPEGAQSHDGRVLGCYLHGIFSSDAFRASWLERIGGQSDLSDYDSTVEQTLDALASHLEEHLDLDALFGLACQTA